ncbi:hypothetical protein V496_00912 [Pseudogymnoascus sp. VKM F-4515 (FW-2607)]|nr:hypothetical protein V496_00912 [Pseudogymnoascus sp. VKM F-4515 (FW-2607)]KFY88924.1 hypothetical protein V498_06611 [Pseudogymnoascus sp. VKM F-4517 (FW-2822)]
MSVQAPSSRMDLCANQSTGAEKLQVTVGAGCDYRHYDVRQYARPSIDASGNGLCTSEQYGAQPSISPPHDGYTDNVYYTGQQYAAQVAAGIVNLGINASPALQLSLTDQHGSFRAREPVYSTTGKGAQFLGDSQNPGVWDESLQYEPCVELGNRSPIPKQNVDLLSPNLLSAHNWRPPMPPSRPATSNFHLQSTSASAGSTVYNALFASTPSFLITFDTSQNLV